LKGRGFSRAADSDLWEGYGFSRTVKRLKDSGALAPEGRAARIAFAAKIGECALAIDGQSS
jgi:hypothetical protein